MGTYFVSFLSGAMPDPLLTVTEWADTKRYLPPEGGPEPGLYRSSRVPYAREIMDALSPTSPVKEVVVLKPTQGGFTEIANNFIMCTAELYPAPTLFAMPTENMAKNHSKKKIAPSIRITPSLFAIIKESKSRESGNTILTKEFPGGSWRFVGSNSPTAARSDSIRYLVIDDFDGFSADMGGEGSPGDLLKKRTDAYPNTKKIYINSTPTNKGASNIEVEWEESSQGYWNVPCPHCDELFFFYFTFFKYETKEITRRGKKRKQVIEESMHFVCPHCSGEVKEHHKFKAMERGSYIHEFPEIEKKGFKVNAFHSPFISWKQIVTEWIDAQGNKAKLKVFINTRLADVYEESGEQPEWASLKARAEPYPLMIVPEGGKMLCCGADTQPNRVEIVLKAYGAAEESWLIAYHVIYGNPDKPELWKQIDDEILNRTYDHASGGKMRLSSFAIDAGGANWMSVLNFARTRHPLVTAVKGASTPNKPIISGASAVDVAYDGHKIKDGAQIYTVGVDTAKDLIYTRLKFERDPSRDEQPGYMHFPIGMDDEYYQMLTAEKKVTTFDRGNFPSTKYVKTRGRNEALDCEVYCYAGAIKAGLQRTDLAAIKITGTAPEVRISASKGAIAAKNKGKIVGSGMSRQKKW